MLGCAAPHQSVCPASQAEPQHWAQPLLHAVPQGAAHRFLHHHPRAARQSSLLVLPRTLCLHNVRWPSNRLKQSMFVKAQEKEREDGGDRILLVK